jgi:hypothetical protein
MQNWQRGTTFASSATYFYTADRWGVDGGATGRTISRQVTGDTTNLPFIQYCTRVQRDSGNAATTRIRILQPFETVNTIPLAGKTITFSWYARAGANYSAAAGALGITVYAGTGTDENPRTGTYTGQTLPINTAVTLTTTWQRFSQTVALASTVTEITPMLYQDYVGTAGAADYFDFTGFQIDIGSVALPFRTYAATIQGELAACQRYYNRLGNTIGNSAQRLGVGPGANSTVASVTFYLPVNLRTATTSVDFSGLQLYQGTATYAVTAVAINAQSSQNPNANLTVASGLTGGQFYEALTTTTAGYIAFNAEL